MKTDVLLYGANGYSAKLVLKQFLKSGIKPILGGRNESEVEKIADENNLDCRIFGLEIHSEIMKGLENITILINCAGPFSNTAKPLLEACLEKKVHYFDITGEIDVFAMAHSYDDRAKQQGIIICPGVGFDVVPTDCLASMLKEQFQFEAVNLELGFHPEGGASKGTAFTSLEGTGTRTRIRRDGQIVTAPYGKYTKEIPFPHKKLKATAIPWGDVYTSYISTGIPNVTVYMVMHPKTISLIQKSSKLFFLRKIQPFKCFITRQVKKTIPEGGGPSEEVRSKTKTYVWGCISDSNGNSLTKFITTPNCYDLTAISPVKIVSKFESIKDKKGYFTPSLLFGSKFVLNIPRVEVINSQ